MGTCGTTQQYGEGTQRQQMDSKRHKLNYQVGTQRHTGEKAHNNTLVEAHNDSARTTTMWAQRHTELSGGHTTTVGTCGTTAQHYGKGTQRNTNKWAHSNTLNYQAGGHTTTHWREAHNTHTTTVSAQLLGGHNKNSTTTTTT